MKSRYVLATTSLISALAGATPAMAGPLGLVSGGAGAVGALGTTLSGAGGNPAFGAGSAIGAGGQFQGAFTPPNLGIERAPIGRTKGTLESVNERARTRVEGATEAALEKSTSTVGGAGSAATAAANAQGSGDVAASKPGDPGVRMHPLRVPAASASARGEASASARGDASTRSASAEADGSAQTEAQIRR